MPFFVVYSRSVPLVGCESSSSGAPKARARRRVSGLVRSARICGRLGRWMAPVCRSMPYFERPTISRAEHFADYQSLVFEAAVSRTRFDLAN